MTEEPDNPTAKKFKTEKTLKASSLVLLKGQRKADADVKKIEREHRVQVGYVVRFLQKPKSENWAKNT